MPSQKELRWSQLKVGILAVIGLALLTGIIFILSGSTGGLFARKINLRAYFTNANGLKDGAPVTLDGVTIGNVISIKILPNHEPDAVEVISRVGTKYLPALHTDSTVAINQAGVLGDAFIDISSMHATGPQLADGATLKVNSVPGIQDVIRTSQDSIQQINKVVAKVDVLLDSLNNGHGTAAMFLNDPEMAKRIGHTIAELEVMTTNIASGKGSVGKLLTDDTLYNQANSTIAKLNSIATKLDNGEGSAGKLLKDEALYKNINSAVANTNELLANINAGKGSLGRLAKDPALAQRLEESLGNLNTLMKGINEGKGTLGQLAQNPTLYTNLDKTLNETGQLISAIRKDPKTYLTIHVKIF